MSGEEDTTSGTQTIVISPSKPRSEVKPVELVDVVDEPEDSEAGTGSS